MKMHKIMCLDVGTKRIGVALSDYLHVTAKGLCCVPRKPEEEAIKEIGQQKLIDYLTND